MKFVINLVTPDNGERYVVEMSNSTLTNIKGQRAKNPDLTITLNRSDLETVMGGKATFDSLSASGKAKFDGNRKPFDQLRSTLIRFTQDFELIPGTRPATASPTPARDPFEVDEHVERPGG
jgi:alkyl sulfatase BDS1-like metallo-beta-lactamase superfamily hydrolase